MNPEAATLWRGPRWKLAALLACLGMLGAFSIDTWPAAASTSRFCRAASRAVRLATTCRSAAASADWSEGMRLQAPDPTGSTGAVRAENVPGAAVPPVPVPPVPVPVDDPPVDDPVPVDVAPIR